MAVRQVLTVPSTPRATSMSPAAGDQSTSTTLSPGIAPTIGSTCQTVGPLPEAMVIRSPAGDHDRSA